MREIVVLRTAQIRKVKSKSERQVGHKPIARAQQYTGPCFQIWAWYQSCNIHQVLR